MAMINSEKFQSERVRLGTVKATRIVAEGTVRR